MRNKRLHSWKIGGTSLTRDPATAVTIAMAQKLLFGHEQLRRR